MTVDTIKIFKTTILALCLGSLLYYVLSSREQEFTPGTILLQNTLRDTDKVQVFDNRLSPFSAVEGRSPLFSLQTHESREFAKALVLNEAPNMLATHRGNYEFRFLKENKILAKLYYSNGVFSSSTIRWPQGTTMTQNGILAGPLKPSARAYVDSVLQRYLGRPQLP